jgi:hypothetical protein
MVTMVVVEEEIVVIMVMVEEDSMVGMVEVMRMKTGLQEGMERLISCFSYMF